MSCNVTGRYKEKPCRYQLSRARGVKCEHSVVHVFSALVNSTCEEAQLMSTVFRSASAGLYTKQRHTVAKGIDA